MVQFLAPEIVIMVKNQTISVFFSHERFPYRRFRQIKNEPILSINKIASQIKIYS